LKNIGCTVTLVQNRFHLFLSFQSAMGFWQSAVDFHSKLTHFGSQTICPLLT